MTPKDSLLAAMVITIWGVNFMFLKFVLQDLSPMVLGMLRFALVVFPALLWLKRPPVAWRWLVLYGVTISFGQFGLMFAALSLGLPTGLTALILQAQVFITVALAALLWREPIRANHLLGMLTAAAGLLLIGIGQQQGSVPMAALWAILGAAVSWALGNIVVKYIGKVNALSLVVWQYFLAAAVCAGIVCALRRRGRVAADQRPEPARFVWRIVCGLCGKPDRLCCVGQPVVALSCR